MLSNNEIIIEYNGIKRWGADADEYINTRAAGIELLFERSRRHVSIMWLSTIPHRSIYSYTFLVKYYIAMFLNHIKFSSKNFYGACVACGKCRYVGNMAYDKRLDMNIFICFDCVEEVYAIRANALVEYRDGCGNVINSTNNTVSLMMCSNSSDTHSHKHGVLSNSANIIDAVFMQGTYNYSLHFFHRLTFAIEDFYYPNIIRCKNMQKCAICACLEELCGCKAAREAGKKLFIDINWEKMQLLNYITDNRDIHGVLGSMFIYVVS